MRLPSAEYAPKVAIGNGSTSGKPPSGDTV